MATAKSFNVGLRYNFTTLAPTILNAKYSNMLVKGIMVASVATKQADIVTLYETLKGHVDGLPSSINNCTFVVFEDTNGTEIILAKEYIDPFSIEEVTTNNLNILLQDITDIDIATIKKLLAGLGYNPEYTLITE